MVVIASLLHLACILLTVAASEKEYGFLDLFKPEEVDMEFLFTENPSFLGSECGPASYVALKKIQEKSKGQKFAKNLALLTSWDINMTQWDIDHVKPRRYMRSKNIECGDEWKSNRCLERLRDNNIFPRLVIGSHKDISAQSTALYAFINQIMYVYTSLSLKESTPVGHLKVNKGWSNTVRLIHADHNVLKSFLQHFQWTRQLKLITEVFEPSYVAEDIFDQMDLLGNSELIKFGSTVVSPFQFYPFSYTEQKDNLIDDWENERLNSRQNVLDTYFEGIAIKNSSRSKYKSSKHHRILNQLHAL